MIWSHLPSWVKEDGAVCCPVKMPSGTWYVDKVVCGLFWCRGISNQAEFSDFQLEKGVCEGESLQKEDGSLFVKQPLDDSGTV